MSEIVDAVAFLLENGGQARQVRAQPLRCVEPDDAGLRADDAEDRLQRRRLAGGVAAEQADELALADDEVDALEDVDLPVVGVDRLELEQRRMRGDLHVGAGQDAADARAIDPGTLALPEFLKSTFEP